MSCGCENKKMATEIERIRRLAKALAKIENEIVGIWLNDNGTYGFCKESVISEEIEDKIIEYITPY